MKAARDAEGEKDVADAATVRLLPIARRLGIRVLMQENSRLPGDGALYSFGGGKWTMLVRAEISLERKRFVIAHEIAEWLLLEHEGGSFIEERCDALASVLVAPDFAFRSGIFKQRDRGPGKAARASARKEAR